MDIALRFELNEPPELFRNPRVSIFLDSSKPYYTSYVGSIALNPDYKNGVYECAMDVIADRLRKVFDDD